MDKQRVHELECIATKARKLALKAIQSANSGHVGGSFSVIDILTVLYFEKMNIDPKKPRWENRDRLVLSKGHCSPAMYAILAMRGYFSEEKLTTFRNINSDLSGHVEMCHVPGVDMSTGSLGQGLSVAVGMALSAKVFNKSWRTYAILGDGEIQEGQVWEAAMSAGNFKLDNLIAFVDNNNLQLDGPINEVMSSYPIDEKFKAFKWNVININGHDYEQIANAIDIAIQQKGKPTIIIAKTIKGKGVSFMENVVKFHGSVPTADEFTQAFNELNNKILELEG